MKKYLLSLIAAVASFGAFAEVPTVAFLSASHASSVSVNDKGAVSSYSLTTSSTAPDGGSWFGGSTRTWINLNTRLSASLTGYLTSWYSYDAAPASMRDPGPLHMTRLLSATNEIVLTGSVISNLYGRYEAPSNTDLYAKFTPITYHLAYELDGGAFPGGSSHPETATYDVPFIVSAPVRDFYSFAGWKVGTEIVSNDVPFVNLTTQNGATVSIGALWKPNPYPLQLSLGEGVSKIHYRVSSESAWLVTEKPLTVQVGYGETWSAWAEAAYGWEGSGTGWDPEGVTSGKMTEKGDKFKPEAKRKRFDVKAKPSPSDGGSVTGSGTYEYETQVELTATASRGHSFTGWSTGTAENPLNITVLSATNVTANFTRNSYSLKLTVGEGVSNVWYRLGGAGDFVSVTETRKIAVLYGTKYECYATAKYGYTVSGIGSSEENLWSGTMPDGDLAFVPTTSKNVYRVQVGRTPSEAGTVGGAGNYEYLAQAYLTASSAAGYRFTGWSDGSTENPYWYTVVSNASLVANFTSKAYGFQLVVNEGIEKICYRLQDPETETWSDWTNVTGSTTIDVPYGTGYRVYAVAQKGYSYTGSGSSEGSAVSGTIGTQGFVFAPVAVKKQYLVTVSAEPAKGGTVDKSGTGYFDYGKVATVYANAESGYLFDYWKDMTYGQAKVSEAPTFDFIVTNDTRLVGVFKPDTFTVTFVYLLSNGAEFADVQSVAYGASAVEPPAEKRNNCPGKTFVSWDSSDWQYVTRDMTIRAVYAAGSYSVHFDANGGSGSMNDQPFKCDEYQNLSKCTFTRTGFGFDGWSTDPNATTRQYKDEQSVRNLASSGTVTLYAVWVPVEYTIRFEPNGAKGEAYEVYVKYNEEYVMPECKFESTVPFTGWQHTKTYQVYQPGEKVSRLSSVADGSGRVTFKALWGNGAQVRFDANWDGVDPNHRYVYQTFSNEVENALLANSFTRTGYTFAGWTNTTGRAYGDQELVTDPAKPGDTLDLYAVWKPNTYQVVFDRNKGTSGKMDPVICTWDKIRDVEAKYVRVGYTLIGFDTDSESTDPSIEIKKNATSGVLIAQIKNLTSIPNDHIRLYAIWNVPTVQSVLKKTLAAPLLAAPSTSILTSSPQPEWENKGWEDQGDGVYSNGKAAATLSTTVTTNGTLTFEWMPSAVGDMTIGTKIASKTIDEAQRLSSATLSVNCAGVVLTNLTGAVSRSWMSVTVAVENVTAPVSMVFSNDASTVHNKAKYDGVYPCMLKNIVWTPAKAPTPEVYKITYTGLERATHENPDTFTAEDEFEFTAPSARAGYDFAGWEPTGITKGTTHDVTAAAKWTAQPGPGPGPEPEPSETNTVTFAAIDPARGRILGGGALRQTFDSNASKALSPTVVGINGWDFAGWSTNKADEVDVSADGVAYVPITSDITFRAVFKAHTYPILYANARKHNNPNPVRFTSAGGTQVVIDGETMSSYEYKPLEKIGAGTEAAFTNWNPKVLSAGVYGWYDDKSGVFNYTKVVTQAIWADMIVETDKLYTVTFTAKAEDGACADTNDTRSVGRGKNVADVPVFAARDGYRFTGWDRSLDNVKSDFETKAEYALNRYSLTYSNLMGATHDNPESYTVEDAVTLRSPKNDNTNIRWIGWTTNGVLVSGIAKGTTNDIAFAGTWAYHLTFKGDADNRVRFAGGASKVDLYVAEEVGATNTPEVVVKAGYSFAGWQNEKGDIYPAGTVSNVTEAATYTAVATANVYRVTYEGIEPETNNPANPETFTVEYAVVFEEPLARAGYRFAGWSPAGIERGTTSNVTTTARWTKGHVVSFTAGGNVTLAGETTVTVDEGGSVAFPTATPDRGYALDGWYDEKGGRVDGGKVTNVTASATYTAVATACVYRITYENLKGATNNAANPATYTVESGEITFAAPIVTNATESVEPFAGWTPDRIAAGSTGDVTVVASWGVTYRVEAKCEEGRGSVALHDGEGEGAVVPNPGRYLAGTNLVAVATAAEGWAFSGWEDAKTGVACGAAGVRALPLTVTNDVVVTAVFTQRVYTVTVDGVATGVRYGETVTRSKEASVTNGAVNVVCTGWVGTGDVPERGTSNSVSFVVTQASSLTWLYATNYFVSVGVADGGRGATALPGGTVELYDEEGEETANPGWYASGTNLVAVATAAEGEGWLFAGWEDAKTGAPCGAAGVRALPLVVTNAVAVTAVFTQRVYTVSFVLDGHLKRTGGGALVQTVAYGGAATLPIVEGKGYYDLEGWQLVDATSSSRQDIDEDGFLIDAAGRRVHTGEVPDVTGDLHFDARSVEAGPYIAATVEKEYEPKVVIDPIVVRCVHEEEATLKVTGLPSGLSFTTKEKTYTAKVGGVSRKLTAPANSIYGTPSKSGLYTAVATATLDRETIATTNLAFVVRADGETVVKTVVPEVEGEVPGKTTGQGVYADGKKVTLKAKADKGYVFSGWYGAGGGRGATALPAGLVSRAASLAIVVPEEDVAYEARFVTKEDDAESISACVNGMTLVSGGSAGAAVSTNVSAGVYLEWPVAADAASAVTVTVSGLPSGLKFTAKPVTKTVTVDGVRTVVTNVPAMTIYGIPTAASKVDRYGDVVPSQVKVTVKTAGSNKATGVIALTVEALPTELVGTYVGGSTNGPTGSASVTLAKTGKISGKWVSEGKTWTLSASGFDAVAGGGGRGATALPAGGGDAVVGDVFVATVTFKCGKETETRSMAFAVNGLGYGAVVARALPDEEGAVLFSATYVPWKADEELKELAKELKGEKFVIASDDGTTLSGTVGASGVVSVKGEFELGAARPYTATVSATLVPVDGDLTRFELLVYYPPKESKGFDGYAETLILTWDGETLGTVLR